MLEGLGAAAARTLEMCAARPWRSALLIIIVSLTVLLPGLTTLPVTDRDEARFAQASKQMLESGDLIDIRFQDQPRWKKPAGIYWLQSATAGLAGGKDAPIWAYRLPSVLGAILTALFTWWAARAVVSERWSLLAGLMMAIPLLLTAEGNIAKTDAALAATAAAVLGAMMHLFLGRGGLATALIFWIALAVSILLKGPIVPAIAAIVLVAMAWRRETRAGFARLRISLGLGLVAVLVLPWLVAIWHISDGGFFRESLGQDMAAKVASGQENHWGPPGLYLGLVWFTFWPWAALLPLAAATIWAARKQAWGLLILAWVVPFWLILEAVPTKLPHYVLPLYPALMLGLICWMATAPPIAGRGLRIASAILVALPGVALGLATAVLPIALSFGVIRGLDESGTLQSMLSIPGVVLTSLGAGLSVIAAQAALRGQILRQIGVSMAAAVALYSGILQYALPAMTTGFPSPTLATLHAQYRACASGPGFSIGYHEPSFVFLTETGIRMADPEAALAALGSDPGAMVFLTDRWAGILQGSVPPSVERESIRYFNYNRGKMERIRLLTSDDARWTACTS